MAAFPGHFVDEDEIDYGGIEEETDRQPSWYSLNQIPEGEGDSFACCRVQLHLDDAQSVMDKMFQKNIATVQDDCSLTTSSSSSSFMTPTSGTRKAMFSSTKEWPSELTKRKVAEASESGDDDEFGTLESESEDF